jgi:LysR family transcriptional regulator, low CO2-responsive transcriptional regulator
MMRYRLIVVAGPGHRLAAASARPVPTSALAGHNWLVGPSGADASSDTSRLLARLRIPESRLRVFPSEKAAWVAAAEGHGLSPAVHHLVAPELARGALVPVAVEGTPVDLFWYVSTLSPDRRSPGATRLRRFLATPDAMLVMSRGDGGVPAARFRPPVYVTLWS